MSLIVKLGLVGVAAGVGSLATLSQLGDIRHRMGMEVPSLASLTSLVGIGASATSPSAASPTGAPIDKTFTVRRVHIDGIVAKVEIVPVAQPGPVRLQANGKPDTMKELQVRTVGDELLLSLETDEDDEAWFPWNLFNMWSEDRKVRDLSVRITAPVGTPYELEGMVGIVTAGDLDAPLRFVGHAVEARIGRTINADVSIKGSGHITLGAVKEVLDIDVSGSGDISAASAAAAKVEISGGGDVKLGQIAGNLTTDIRGAGDVRVAQVNGAVDLKIRGAGDITIEGGRADPFSVDIAGAGDVTFKGHAVNPTIRIRGAGDVSVDSYSGQLRQEISGAGNFTSRQETQPPTPTPPPPPPPG
jgi:hypothetical protein